MNIYKLDRTSPAYYDEYDSFIVAANTPEEAYRVMTERDYGDVQHAYPSSWPDSESQTNITRIGETTHYKAPQRILGSFNAG